MQAGAHARTRCRGRNALAELEALVVLGAGAFDQGVHYVANVANRVGIVQALQDYEGHVFADLLDRRDWATTIYERDERLLRNLAGTVAEGLSTALTIAWPHIPSALHERIETRLAELPPDENARPWRARGAPRWWAPPKPPGIQVHFVDTSERDGLHPGVPR